MATSIDSPEKELTMGAWGAGSFENDDALEYLDKLLTESSSSQLRDTFEQIRETGDAYLEAPEGSQGLAAAEVVARLVDPSRKKDDRSGQIAAWGIKIKFQPDAKLKADARQAVERIASDPSELLELWNEGGDDQDWKAAVDDLLSRLS